MCWCQDFFSVCVVLKKLRWHYPLVSNGKIQSDQVVTLLNSMSQKAELILTATVTANYFRLSRNFVSWQLCCLVFIQSLSISTWFFFTFINDLSILKTSAHSFTAAHNSPQWQLKWQRHDCKKKRHLPPQRSFNQICVSIHWRISGL